MKKVLICLSILFCFFDLVAQDFTLKWDSIPTRESEILSRRKWLTFKENISEDQSKSVSIDWINKNLEDENAELQFFIKDSAYNIIQSVKNIKLPHLNKDLIVKKIFISNDNMIYVYVRVLDASREQRERENIFFAFHKILRINPDTRAVDEFLIAADKLYINECDFTLGKDNMLRGFGLSSHYNEDGKFSGKFVIQGCFTFTLTRSTVNLKPDFKKDLTDDVIKAAEGEKLAKRKKD